MTIEQRLAKLERSGDGVRRRPVSIAVDAHVGPAHGRARRGVPYHVRLSAGVYETSCPTRARRAH